MLLSKEVEVGLAGTNIKHYENLEYEIPITINKNGKLIVPKGIKIRVKIEDLPIYSKIKVKVLCDYCKEKIVEKTYQDYYKSVNFKKSVINKDCCGKCQSIKTKECNLINFGFESKNKLEEIKNKTENTNLIKYGVKYPNQYKEIQDKIKKTNVERYGVEYVINSPEVKDKIKNTMLDRYGVEFYYSTEESKLKREQTLMQRYGVKHNSQLESTKEKTKQTSLKNYGVEYTLQSPIVREKIVQSLYKNNSAPCSKQQKYLCELVEGQLNYPISRINLDLAFPDEMIYCEYDGSGHDLSVKLGKYTIEKFLTLERNRYYFLKNKGWKQIKIISIKDYLPSDEILLQLIELAKKYLNFNHSWFEINIDESKLKCSQYEINYDFGLLRKIKQKDLIEVV